VAELAARPDGTLLGLRAHLMQDAGAYVSGSPRPPEHAAEHLVGPYRLPAIEAKIDAVYTNKVPLTPIRGGGREQGVFVIERLLDHLARQIGADPLAVRERNLIPPGAFPYDTKLPRAHGGTVVYDSGNFPGHLAEARRLIGYDEFKAKQSSAPAGSVRRGVAVTLFIESTGVGPEGARVALQDDGSVLLAVGSPDTGQSHATVMRQICAAELGVSEERIAFVSGDTQAMAVGIGTFASRFAVMAGNATAQAARDVRQHVLRVAAESLEAAEADLEIDGGVVRVVGAPDRSITFAEVARMSRAAGAPIEAVGIYSPEHGQTYAGGAFGSVVAVDVETGEARVERFVAVHDCGTVINPMVVSGQVHGGVAMGIGEALAEAIVYDEHGQLLTADFAGYVVPRAADIPRIVEQERPSLAGTNPEGIKGAGEGGLIGALPVIAAAVEDALAPLDARLTHLPIRSEDLCRICAPLRRLAPAVREADDGHSRER
jgi:CO/xanthine dehydrogenase Mo-binding subunit